MVHPVWVVMVEEVLLIFLGLDCFQPLTLWDYRVPVIKVSLTEGTWLFHFGLLRVARYSFSGSMPPKFEHKLRLHKQRFGKIATTVVLGKDENVLWSGLQWHWSCHSNKMTPLYIYSKRISRQQLPPSEIFKIVIVILWNEVFMVRNTVKTWQTWCSAVINGKRSSCEVSLHLIVVSLFELFWKNSSYVSGLSVCNFVAFCVVALSVRMCVAGANKVEGTMSWFLGTNEILASKHDIAALKVKQGHFATAILVLPNFVAFYCG